jgi:anti-sigma factor RsiW
VRGHEPVGAPNTGAPAHVQPDVLTCYRTRRTLGAYRDGALEPGTARWVASHLATCPACTAEVNALERLRALVRTLPEPAEPDWTGFWPAVVRGIEETRRTVAAPRPAPWPRFRWAVGGVLGAALVGSLTVWQLAPWEMTADRVGPASPVVVRSADTAAPDGTVMVYSTPGKDLTVVWVFGLEQ